MSTTSSQSGPASGLPIIDMHMHAKRMWVAPDGKPLARPRMPQSRTWVSAFAGCKATDYEPILRGTLEAMDQYNIVKGFLSDRALKDVYGWVAAAPDRFIPSPAISGGPDSPSIDFLRAEHAAGRIQGIGEISSQYAGLAPDDPALEPYFALAEELDLPVLIHTCGGGVAVGPFRASLGLPLLLEKVLVKHRKLRLWVENAGYPFLGETVALMNLYPEAYADLSTVTWIFPREAFHDFLRGLMRSGLGKRLMFGSDQMMWPETIGMAIEGIETAEFLTGEQKRTSTTTMPCVFCVSKVVSGNLPWSLGKPNGEWRL